MAVYEHTYRRYVGPTTPPWQRVLVLPRYIFKDVFKSKLFVAFFSLCFAFPLFGVVSIYIMHNIEQLLPLLDGDLPEFFAVDAAFFNFFLQCQGVCAFVIALFIGPGLISRDLNNNGLPLYLYRPFSRTEYVTGKMLVLATLLSAVTWVPGSFLYILQSNLAKGGWFFDNLGMLSALFVGSWIWILVISLLALAFSAWVKWRPVAGFLMLFVLFGGSTMSFLINQLFKTKWGSLLNLQVNIDIVWASLFGLKHSGPPVFAAWIALAAFAGFCLFLLHRKIRAYEVVS